MPLELEYDYETTTASMDKFSQDDINNLKQWTQNLDKTKCVPKDLLDKQLVLFYNACYGDMDRTKACIEKYYSCRKNAPEFFDNRKVSSPEMAQTIDAVEVSVLPGKTHEGYDIVYHRLHQTEPSKYHFEPSVKLLFMTIDMCLNKRGPQNGLVFLFDMRGVKLGHIARCGLTFQKEKQRGFRKFFSYLQEAMPVRMRAIHVLNTEPVLDKLLLVVRPFMEKKFFDMINFHHKDEDLEPFFATAIPRSSVPQDHGGSLPDTQTLHKKCIQQLQGMEPYFKAEEEQRIMALPDKKRDKAMEKAFKNLDID